jgi:hypothetical protein
MLLCVLIYLCFCLRVAIVLVSLSIYLHASYPAKKEPEKPLVPATTSSHIDLLSFFRDKEKGRDKKTK